MKSITRPLPKQKVSDLKVNGLMVVAATAGEKPLGAIYKLINCFEAVPYDHFDIRRFDNPHDAQRHIEKMKLGR